MTSKEFLEKHDKCYNRFNKYEHIYCEKCKHSMYFKVNHPAICGYCGSVVYPTKRSEFKSKLKKEIIKNKGESNE